MSVGWARYAFKFGEYYRNQSIDSYWTPSRLRSREWMFDGFDERPPERHRGFRTTSELVSHVVRKVPKSCFYSTAYYRDPNQRKMSDKGWRGADLIFDLDGDHLPGVSDGDFPTMISVIQDQAWRLWTEFLEPEYGFSEEHLQLTFSGHRGFHLHYRSPDIWGLDSHARREIVSHIRGEGINLEAVIAGPDCAWKNRLIDSTDTVLHKLDLVHEGGDNRKSIIGALKDIVDARIGLPGVDIKRVTNNEIITLAEKVQHVERRQRLRDSYKERGEVLRAFGGKLDKVFRQLIIGDKSVVLGNAGETDENVTVDIKRVIRWPTSLHGKSGMKVMEFPLSRLNPDNQNAFDPLTEAVPWNMGANDVKIRAIRSDVQYRIGLSEGELSEGESYNVNEATATFLILKKWAEPID